MIDCCCCVDDCCEVTVRDYRGRSCFQRREIVKVTHADCASKMKRRKRKKMMKEVEMRRLN